MKRRTVNKGLGLLALGALAPAAPAAAAGGRSRRQGVTVGFVVGDPQVREVAGGAEVSVPVLADGRSTAVVTEVVTAEAAGLVAGAVRPGSLVDFVVDDGRVLVQPDPGATFHTVLVKGDVPTFVAKDYGPELAARADGPGDLVAAGWVYAKRATSITVGDGRRVPTDITGRPLPRPVARYEETYRLRPDVAVYEVDTADWSRSRPATWSEVPVTADRETTTTERQAVFVVLDQDHRYSSRARVAAVYYFTPADVSDGLPVWDVPTQSALLADKGVDPVTGLPYAAIVATSVRAAPYTRSTEPFEIVPGTFYYVGDNEVALYLFAARSGGPGTPVDRLVLFDTGWPNSGYQYWKNIEAVGFDPRQITDVMLSHGHGDHYGTTNELLTMIESAGGSVRLHASREDVEGISVDALGNEWAIPVALPASEVAIRTRYVPYVYDEYLDLGTVRLLPTPTPGHTVGTTSFVFEVEHPDDGRRITFGYMGGYGFNGLTTPTATNGYRRLGFQLGLSWLQQRVEVDYVTAQHTNQYPLVEVYQALKAHNNDPANHRDRLGMLDALTTGEFVNFNEKRYAVATNARSDSEPGYQSIETYGPFKPGREGGLRDVEVRLLDGGKVVRGFDKHQNVNPRIALLSEGIVIEKDSYVHDPDGWYVQLYLDVQDGYGGFLPGSGPVESVRPAAGAPEILRTQRLGSREEAEAVLATVVRGGRYRVDLTPASAVVVPPDGSAVFSPS